jgi:hypothetical protein
MILIPLQIFENKEIFSVTFALFNRLILEFAIA